MTNRHGQPPDDVSSAPESGTVRNDTTGNQPSDRGNDPGQRERPANAQGGDDPAVACEER